MEQKIYQIDEIKSKLFPIFEANPVYRAILFGSYARGNATDQSDIDIVIDSKGELLNMGFYGILEDIATALNKRVDLFEISELKRNTAICSAIEREGIIIYDRERKDEPARLSFPQKNESVRTVPTDSGLSLATELSTEK